MNKVMDPTQSFPPALMEVLFRLKKLNDLLSILIMMSPRLIVCRVVYPVFCARALTVRVKWCTDNEPAYLLCMGNKKELIGRGHLLYGVGLWMALLFMAHQDIVDRYLPVE